MIEQLLASEFFLVLVKRIFKNPTLVKVVVVALFWTRYIVKYIMMHEIHIFCCRSLPLLSNCRCVTVCVTVSITHV